MQTVDIETGEIYENGNGALAIPAPADMQIVLSDEQVIALSEHILEIGKRELAEKPEFAQVKERHAQAAAYDQYMQRMLYKRACKTEAHNNLIHLVILYCFEMGILLNEMPQNHGERGRFTGGSQSEPPVELPPTYADMNISKKQAARFKRWARERTKDEIEDAILTWKEMGWEVSTYDVDKLINGALPMQSSESNEWYTPRQYIEAARTVMGSIDTDPASSDLANKTVKAKTYYTAQNSGLDKDWFGNIWLNPPYGGIAADFIARLLQQYKDGNVAQAVVLVNANATDTQWFYPLFDYLLCFTDHRIDFISPGAKGSTSTHGSCFIYLGTQSAEFAHAFSKFGNVVQRWQP